MQEVGRRSSYALRKSNAACPGPDQALIFLRGSSLGLRAVVPLSPFISAVSTVDILCVCVNSRENGDGELSEVRGIRFPEPGICKSKLRMQFQLNSLRYVAYVVLRVTYFSSDWSPIAIGWRGVDQRCEDGHLVRGQQNLGSGNFGRVILSYPSSSICT